MLYTESNQYKVTEHERIETILSDYEWHSTKEFVFTHHLTKVSTRLTEMARNGLQIERRWIKIDGVKWREYRLVRPEPQQVTIPLTTTYTA